MTVRVKGPSVPTVSQGWLTGTRPRDGFRPTTPQHEAGTRMEPPPSEPQASAPTPTATDAAAPPLDPPEVCVVRQGLLVVPVKPLWVTPRPPNSGVVVLP